MPMALEQRFMFDGAAPATAVDVVDAASAPLAQDSGVLHFAAPEKVTPAVAASQQLAEKAVTEALKQPDATQQLFSIFSGGQSAPSAEWLRAAQELIAKVGNGEYSVQVELRSSLELRGALGAFAAQGENGTPVIYLNADWLQMGPDTATIARVLAEEIGHSFDAVLNRNDTPGDEGDAFATQLFGGNPTDSQRLADSDQAILTIDGTPVSVEEASVTFKAVYQGTPSAWSLQSLEHHADGQARRRRQHHQVRLGRPVGALLCRQQRRRRPDLH